MEKIPDPWNMMLTKHRGCNRNKLYHQCETHFPIKKLPKIHKIWHHFNIISLWKINYKRKSCQGLVPISKMEGFMGHCKYHWYPWLSIIISVLFALGMVQLLQWEHHTMRFESRDSLVNTVSINTALDLTCFFFFEY